MFTVSTLVFKIGIMTLAALYTAKKTSLFSSWAIWIVVSFLISPYGGTYAYILALIPLLILYENKKVFVIYALLTFVAINLPIKYLYTVPLFFQFPRLYLLLALFVILVFWANLPWNWKIFVSIACLFISIEVLNFQYQTDNSTYLFEEGTTPIAYDYAIEDGYFCYTYWSGNGIQKHKTRLQATALDFQTPTIIDNQIFYKNQQITSSPDKKLKASVLDNNVIVYLSDKGRGYGFYTFRKILLDGN